MDRYVVVRIFEKHGELGFESHIKKNPLRPMAEGILFGAAGGIRTHVRLPAN